MPKKFDIRYIDENTIIFNGEKISRVDFGKNTCRKIFITDDYVIKIDTDDLPQCEDEFNLWKIVSKTEYKKYFVPIVFQIKIKETNRLANIQKRVNLNHEEFCNRYDGDESFYKIIKKISKTFGLIDISNSRNATVDENGDLLIFDYGI